VKNIHLNLERYFNLLEHTTAKAILAFCPETYKKGHDLNVRVFADYYGVPEDSASGSGNGSLAAFLLNYGYFGNKKIDIINEQGYEIGRPSLLYVRAEKNDKYDINVGGKVILTARGELEL
jgi:trans-2,3-dihydro-3-hydroxyanthranilate isomerase